MTPKQEHFARLFIETGNASGAYRRAYDAENMKPETITNEAYKLLQDPDITAMIDGLKAEHRARHAVTVDDVIAELEQARQTALNAPTPQSGAAVSASMGKAKILGLIVDKAEIADTTPPKSEPFRLDESEVKAVIELLGEKGKAATVEDLEAITGDSAEKIGLAAVMLYVQHLI